jgi:hypothetical protein
LSLCVQGKEESDRDYLTRWTALRNTCEGVHEVQAIQYFSDGYRDGTLLKHKLMRLEPATMAELMAIADKYVTAGDAMQKPIRLDTAGKVITEPASCQPAPSDGINATGMGRGRTSSRTTATAPGMSQPSRRSVRPYLAAGARREPSGLGSQSSHMSRCSMHHAHTTATPSHPLTPIASAAGPSA